MSFDLVPKRIPPLILGYLGLNSDTKCLFLETEDGKKHQITYGLVKAEIDYIFNSINRSRINSSKDYSHAELLNEWFEHDTAGHENSYNLLTQNQLSARHIKSSEENMLEGIKRVKNKDVAMVLAPGLLEFRVVIPTLCQQFKKVILVVNDDRSLEMATAKVPVDLIGKVEVRKADLSRTFDPILEILKAGKSEEITAGKSEEITKKIQEETTKKIQEETTKKIQEFLLKFQQQCQKLDEFVLTITKALKSEFTTTEELTKLLKSFQSLGFGFDPLIEAALKAIGSNQIKLDKFYQLLQEHLSESLKLPRVDYLISSLISQQLAEGIGIYLGGVQSYIGGVQSDNLADCIKSISPSLMRRHLLDLAALGKVVYYADTQERNTYTYDHSTEPYKTTELIPQSHFNKIEDFFEPHIKGTWYWVHRKSTVKTIRDNPNYYGCIKLLVRCRVLTSNLIQEDNSKNEVAQPSKTQISLSNTCLIDRLSSKIFGMLRIPVCL